MRKLRRVRVLVMKKMSERPLLTIAYSTLAPRVGNIEFPKFREDQEILVVVQNEDEASYVVSNPKARLVELKNNGVAKSRNAAMDRASGKYLLFADDDVVFENSGIDQAVDYLENNPNCAIVLARAVDESGSLRKRYTETVTPLKLTNSARAATYEMLIRLDSIKGRGIRFDEEFGAGAKFYLGDEYIFIADALRAGLVGAHLPITIARHPSDSSGSRWGERSDLKARAQVFTRVFGWKAPFYRAAFLIRTENKFPGLVSALRFIFNR